VISAWHCAQTSAMAKYKPQVSRFMLIDIIWRLNAKARYGLA